MPTTSPAFSMSAALQTEMQASRVLRLIQGGGNDDS